jgi:hypothetical protein
MGENKNTEIKNLCDELHEFVIESESDEEPVEPIIRVLSIDVGIRNFALSVSILHEDFTIKEVVFVELIDITTFVHRNNPKKCKKYHSKCFADWMEHVFEYHKEFFHLCDYILIERQPPQGLVAIEQLIFSRFRNKAILISPSSMHKFLNIGGLDYENRKVETEKACLKIINSKCPSILDLYNIYDRKHDIADSICMVIFWASKKHKKYIDLQTKKEIESIRIKRCGIDLSLDEWFDQFRFRPRKKLRT